MGNWIRKNIFTVILVACMLVGIGLLLYPSIANYWNSFHQTRAIMAYSDAVSSMTTEDYKAMLESAREYNKQFAETGMRWNMTDEERAAYEAELDVRGTGVMGYISIPKFHINCSIYHGTDESVLQVAIGHIEASSLPVGGKSTHTVVSGHRGLPSARLFTDIDKIKEGDTWTINVLNETYTYECDQIRIVEPTDLTDLQIEEGKDLCTLVTCTPYGINTHRLLVRGRRVANANGTADVTADGIRIEPIHIAPFLGIPVIIILLIVFLIATRKAKRIDPSGIVEQYLKLIGADKADRKDDN